MYTRSWRSISKLDIRALDGLLYLINPGKMVLGTMIGIIGWVEFFMNQSLVHFIIPSWLWFSLLAFGFFYIIYSIIVDSNQRINKVKSIISLFFFNYTYVPLFVWAFFTAGKKVWVRTDHSRNISMNEIHLGTSQAAAGKKRA